jgi:hypothetical protein
MAICLEGETGDLKSAALGLDMEERKSASFCRVGVRYLWIVGRGDEAPYSSSRMESASCSFSYSEWMMMVQPGGREPWCRL